MQFLKNVQLAKKKDPSVVDLKTILTRKVQVNGEEMDSREVELRQQIKKALDPKGPLKSIRYVIEVFEQHDAMKPPDVTRTPLELPSTMEFPWAVQLILLRRSILPPWSDAEVATAKAMYLESRSEGDRIYDAAAGHEEWLMT